MKHRAQGYSLISVMIGLLISIIVMLAMLSLNKALIKIATNSKQQVTQERESASSMLTAQEELQQAGFGLSAAVSTDFVLIKQAHLSGGKLEGTAVGSLGSIQQGNAMVWGYNPTGASVKVDSSAYRCAGLMLTDQGMLWLQPVACTSATQWALVKWQSQQLAAVAATGKSASFKAGMGSCWPYGQSDPVKGLLVSYYTTASLDSASFKDSGTGGSGGTSATTASTASTPLFTVCLPNFGT